MSLSVRDDNPSSVPAPPSVPGPPLTEGLDRSLITGIAWTGGVKWFAQILSWIATLIIARILTLGDYGIANMAATYIGLVQLVSDFGLSAAVVQQRDLSDDDIARLGGTSVLLGVFFSVLSAVLANAIAAFFEEPALRDATLVLSITFALAGLQVLPRSLLARDLRFAALAWVEGLEALVLTVATITLALMHFGYWALIIGGLVSRVAGTIALLFTYPHRISWPTPLQRIMAPLTFGGHVLLASLAWYAFRSADMAIVGKELGKIALGAYAIGFNLASIPVERISALVSRATPAVLAAVQTDAAALRRYLLRLTEVLALVTMPVAVGLALVSREFILVFLGSKWEPAVGPLRVLALAAVFRSVAPLLNQVLVATGQARRNMQATVAIAIVLPPLFLVGSRWGITGVSLVWLTIYPVVAAAFMARYALAASETSAAQYLESLGPALGGVACMSLAVLVVGVLIPRTWPPIAPLSMKVIVGAIVYVAFLWKMHRERVETIARHIRTVPSKS
jgi:PST family polysaccharide transporter